MKEISFVVNNLGHSELSYDLIRTVNKHPENSNSIFYQNVSKPPIVPKCLVSNLTSLPLINGTAVVFNLECAQLLNNAGCKTRNILYLYDMEWLFKPISFMFARNLLKNFEIFTIKESYAELVRNYSNGHVTVIPTIEELYDCLMSK